MHTGAEDSELHKNPSDNHTFVVSSTDHVTVHKGVKSNCNGDDCTSHPCPKLTKVNSMSVFKMHENFR